MRVEALPDVVLESLCDWIYVTTRTGRRTVLEFALASPVVYATAVHVAIRRATYLVVLDDRNEWGKLNCNTIGAVGALGTFWSEPVPINSPRTWYLVLPARTADRHRTNQAVTDAARKWTLLPVAPRQIRHCRIQSTEAERVGSFSVPPPKCQTLTIGSARHRWRAELPPVPRIPSTVKRLVLHDFSPNHESIFADLLVGDGKLPRKLRSLSIIDSGERLTALLDMITLSLPQSLVEFRIDTYDEPKDRWVAIGDTLAEKLPELTSLRYFAFGNGPPCSAARVLTALPNGGRLRELKVETTIDTVAEVMALRQLGQAMPDEVDQVEISLHMMVHDGDGEGEIEPVVEFLSRTPITREHLCIVLEDYYISDRFKCFLTSLGPRLSSTLLSLDLSSCGPFLSSELVTALFPYLPPTLEALLLINNDLTMAHFAGVSSWPPNLRHLDLSGNWLDKVPVPVPRKMQYLGVSGNVAVRMFNNSAADHGTWVRALPSSLRTIELYYGKAAVMQALLEHFPDRPDHWRLRIISRDLRGGTWAESAGELGVPLDAMRAKFDMVDGKDLAEEGLLGIVGRPRWPDVTKIDEGE
ncbi:hypothetical protein GGF31_007543 [Allomyces arbusculus]|nr:hypothetical protein GGF31_007543 [Allomyces arbusculus]